MSTRLTLYFLGMVFTLTALALPDISPNTGYATFAENIRVTLEIADTPGLRARGLMRRKQLDKQKGMLFIYPETGLLRVWMKNTLLALDAIFLADDGRIVSVLQHLPPCRHTHCPVYSSVKKARYMLEVNAGFITEHNIQIGQEVMLEYEHIPNSEKPE